jgi:RNA polymerase sigma-70 factor (ECF subfamily)
MRAVADADLLFNAHRHGVFRYFCRVVGHRETAHDLTQEVFLRVSRAPVPAADDSALRAWVFTIARNLALNHRRDDLRRPQTVDVVADSVAPASQETAAAVRQALAALSDVDRDVFLMRESAGLSYDDIASACDLSVEAVRSRLRRARQQLRETLSGALSVQRQYGVRFGRDRPVD